jgi:hypothetical protein
MPNDPAYISASGMDVSNRGQADLGQDLAHSPGAERALADPGEEDSDLHRVDSVDLG